MKELSKLAKKEVFKYLNSKEGKIAIKNYVRKEMKSLFDKLTFDELLEQKDANRLWKTISRHILKKLLVGFEEV